MGINEVIYDTAKADVGTWEWAKGSNPKVLQYYAEAGHPEIKSDEVPWCAAFVGSVLARCGLQGSGSLMARSYSKWGQEVVGQPKMGDIVVLSRGAPPSGHVGFWAGEQGSSVALLGGNQGDQVNIRNYEKSRIVAIRRAVEPRTGSAVSSKSVQASAIGGVSTAVSGATAVGYLDGTAQIIVIVACVIAAAALAYVARDRIKKWAAGVK